MEVRVLCVQLLHLFIFSFMNALQDKRRAATEVTVGIAILHAE
jgi:hypothetical protein